MKSQNRTYTKNVPPDRLPVEVIAGAVADGEHHCPAIPFNYIDLMYVYLLNIYVDVYMFGDLLCFVFLFIYLGIITHLLCFYILWRYLGKPTWDRRPRTSRAHPRASWTADYASGADKYAKETWTM